MQWIANPQNREFESHPVLQWKVKSIGDENCLENSRALKRLEGSTPLPSAKYMPV